MTFPRRMVGPVAVMLVVLLAMPACSASRRNEPRSHENLPDEVGSSRFEPPGSSYWGEEEIGTVLVIVVAIAAAAGAGYLSYLAYAELFD